MKNADMPAMPLEFGGIGQYAPEAYMGLTKREHFAAMAMQGLLSNPDKDFFKDDLANEAVTLADSLLLELEKQS